MVLMLNLTSSMLLVKHYLNHDRQVELHLNHDSQVKLYLNHDSQVELYLYDSYGELNLILILMLNFTSSMTVKVNFTSTMILELKNFT